MTHIPSQGSSRKKVELDRSPNGVRVVHLVNGAQRNAIDHQMRDELATAIETVRKDNLARTLVVRAEGPAFCAGADVVETFKDADRRPIEQVRDELMLIYDSFLGIRRLAIPTIAAVRGPAIGAGVNLLLSCDIRIAARDAALGFVFTKIGLHPGGGCSFFLTTALGPQRALRVLLDGETLDAQAALDAGLLDAVVDDPDASAMAMAERWAALDPHLVRSVKRSIQIAAESGLASSLEAESWAQAASARGPSIQAVVAKRSGRTP